MCTKNNYSELSIEDYAKVVEQLAAEKVDNIINNEGDEHALVIFENIFNQANKKIRIIAGSLSNNLTSNPKYINALNNFLNKENTSLEILLTKYDPDQSCLKNSPLFNSLKEQTSRKKDITIRTTTKPITVTNQNREIHFCVGDDSMFRFENDIEKRKAICNFNDSGISQKLITIFDAFFNNSTKLDLNTLL